MDKFEKLFNLLQKEFKFSNKITLCEITDEENAELAKNDMEGNELNDIYAGFMKSDIVGDWKYENKRRVCSCEPKSIHIRMKINGNLVEETFVVLTLLHEIAHILTPVVQEKDKVTNKWFFNNHSLLFYQNFTKMLRWADNNKIYHITHSFSGDKYKLSNIQRLDSMFLIDTPVRVGVFGKKWPI